MGFEIQVNIRKSAGAGEFFSGQGSPRGLQNLGILPIKLEHRLANYLSGLPAKFLKRSALGEGENPIPIQSEKNHRRLGDDGAQALLGFGKHGSGFRMNAQTCSLKQHGLCAFSCALRDW